MAWGTCRRCVYWKNAQFGSGQCSARTSDLVTSDDSGCNYCVERLESDAARRLEEWGPGKVLDMPKDFPDWAVDMLRDVKWLLQREAEREVRDANAHLGP